MVSPGEKTPFPNPDRGPDLRRGMHACIADNIWGTNYVMWQPYGPEGRDMRFRFVLQARGSDGTYMQPCLHQLKLCVFRQQKHVDDLMFSDNKSKSAKPENQSRSWSDGRSEGQQQAVSWYRDLG